LVVSDGRFAQLLDEARGEANAIAFEGKLLNLCRIMTRAKEFTAFVDLLVRTPYRCCRYLSTSGSTTIWKRRRRACAR